MWSKAGRGKVFAWYGNSNNRAVQLSLVPKYVTFFSQSGHHCQKFTFHVLQGEGKHYSFFFLLKDDMEQPLSYLLMIFRNHSVWTCSHLGGYAPCHNLQFSQAEKRGEKHILVDFCLFMPQITLVTLCLVLICHKKLGF